MSFITRKGLVQGAVFATLVVGLQASALAGRAKPPSALPPPPPTYTGPVVTVRPPVVVTPPAPVIVVPTCKRGGPGITPC